MSAGGLLLVWSFYQGGRSGCGRRASQRPDRREPFGLRFEYELWRVQARWLKGAGCIRIKEAKASTRGPGKSAGISLETLADVNSFMILSSFRMNECPFV